ncbi:putative PTS system, cellobiose-specific IIC component [Selenomonas ruminantium subsp. lactilytica TAM6421]|uniref:Permease IIC component n=1 Tax=Selenomonas ruminantium subsp. lactilytica (strain NBRC 103574 / TAM6421) TaxID=927704 RepID=I0GMG7_SELRL|nr:PTS transporter subunit EIIC [Selenomonas ruminantium]BAL81954.1 putative PTS system, cellobiose-specific IIC component [Selenomonas ruminantium subsp. lactilytica TAM6421]
MNKQELFDKFIEFMGRFAEIRAVAALRDGFIMTTPFTICGSVFLLLANLPIPGYAEFMAGLFGPEWTAPLNAVSGATFSVLALIAVLAITYKYVEAEGCDAIMAAILALSTFLIVLPPTVTATGGVVVDNIIPKAWAGSNGVITAILVSFVVSWVFCYCEKNHIGIKMPPAVPGGVAKAFEALTPGMVLFTIGAVVYGLCHFMGATTFPELIFKIVQTPLQGLSDTLIGGSVIAALQSILFWAGIHGPNVVGGVVNPILIANSLDNQHIIDMGMQLAGNPDAKIITCQINDVFIKSGGCGLTIGLLIASWLSAKSSQMKSITKLASVPGIFNINEPIIFGLPIVFNPYLLVPFILVPLLALIISYAAIAIGFMNPFSAVQVPWTTPPIIAGLLLNGWQGAVVQIIIIAMSTAVYFPFVRAQDRAMLAEEQGDNAGGDDHQEEEGQPALHN